MPFGTSIRSGVDTSSDRSRSGDVEPRRARFRDEVATLPHEWLPPGPVPAGGGGDGRLASLEEPLPLVARDDGVEEALLGARVVQVVVDDLVPEGRPRHRPRLECRRRLAERPRKALGVGLVCVALERRRELEALLDPVETGREQRGEREIWIDSAAG